MAERASKLDELREQLLLRRLTRRDTLRRALALGLTAPVVGGLLTACGDEDEDPTATSGVGEPTATTTGGGDATATTGEAEPTETEAAAEATGTTGEAEPTEAAGEATGTSDSGAAGEWIETSDRMMGKTIEPAGSEGGTLIEGSFSDISTVNPVMSSDAATNDYLSLIFESLIQANPDTLEPVGALAAAWSTSEDGLTWGIQLQEGITWHDGETLTADDVKFTFELHMNPDAGSSYTADFTNAIASIEVIDDLTVSFTLNQVIADFLLDNCVYAIIAEHVWVDIPAADVAADPGSTGQDAARVVGTGPFMFEEWILEDHASAVKYEDYWDGAPYLDRFVYKVVPDQTAGVQQLLTGEIDFMEGVPESSIAELDGTDVGVFDVPTLSFTFYGTNMDPTKTTLFQEANVRKALLYALDRPAMIESIRFGYGEVAVGTMPVLSWAYNPSGIEETFEYDPDMAAQLLDEAGWVAGGDGVREKDGQRLAFGMYTNAGNVIREAYLTAIQEFWAQIGVEMTPQLEPFPALVERITETFDFEVVLIGFNWSATPDQSAMWACDSYGAGFNFVMYCNEEVDAVMEAALSELDQATRIEMYTEMQNLVLADLPMAVLDFPQQITGLSNRVHNLFPSAVNARFNSQTWWIDS